MIEQFLQQFGLTEKEASIYLYLTRNGESIVSIISKRTGIQRLTTYSTLESLEKKGFVSRFIKNDVSYYEAEDPEQLVTICQAKIQNLKQMEKEAERVKNMLYKMKEAKASSMKEVRGKIRYYEGMEAVKTLIDETLEEKGSEILCFGINDFHIGSKESWKQYTAKRVAQGITVKSIQPNTELARAYKNRDKQELRETILVDDIYQGNSCEINIMGDTIAMFSTNKQGPSGTKIVNKDIALALKNLFQLAWDKSKI